VALNAPNGWAAWRSNACFAGTATTAGADTRRRSNCDSRGGGLYRHIFVAYAMRTGGMSIAMLEPKASHACPARHCYEFFATSAAVAELSKAEPGTFYLNRLPRPSLRPAR